ncbi:response regulator transcription factor [Paraburkholderia sp. SIMBA_054]|uniref:response regulator transcription factor n=1 Tax=Paraburkholderia sp. SIMBA_054 TaxID=3085795 RepID=UPI00397E7579
MNKSALVYVVDDDLSVRDAVTDLLASVGYDVLAYSSASEFLTLLRSASKEDIDRTSCVILDVRMPEIDGLEAQRYLLAENIVLPVIFMTGHGDIPMAIKAMRAGASDFLEKPFRDHEILNAVRFALEQDAGNRNAKFFCSDLLERFERLTPREKLLLQKIASGSMTKQIASDLHLSEITIKVARRELMHKMGAKNLIDLLRLEVKLQKCRRERKICGA